MTEIHQIENLQDRSRVFKDRREAGETLARMLAPRFGKIPRAITLAIPAGGVPVGLSISRKLESDFDLLIVRKIQMPGNTESGIGAVTHEGSVFLNESLLARLDLPPDQIERQTAKVVAELERRNRLFRDSAPAADVGGKTVILVDDGLASGYTMLAAVFSVRKAGAGRVIIAVPTGPEHSVRLFESKVDAVYCANIRRGPYFAVADAYLDWHDLDLRQVVQMLDG
jgi:predicted phosphoribosyltransferase